MRNKKETPVRWLVDEYNTSGDLTWTDFDHALQMEAQKQQKYDEMLGMLEVYLADLNNIIPRSQSQRSRIYDVEQLIKEAKEL
jgi:hypothetical protein